jgi:hypothetical protein
MHPCRGVPCSWAGRLGSRMIRLFSPCMQMMSLPVSRALELLLLAASCMHAMPSCAVQCSAAPLWRPSLPSPAHSGRAVPACCVCVCVPAPVVPVPAGLPPHSSLCAHAFRGLGCLHWTHWTLHQLRLTSRSIGNGMHAD